MSIYFPKYQSANLSNEEIIDNFVVRTKEFEKVMDDIRTTEPGTSFQHYIFVGRRGAGKSTLLRRIQAEVSTQPKLTERFIITNLGEEQTGVYQLYDLWDYVIRDLQAKSYSIPTLDWQEYQNDLTEYTKQLYYQIHDCLEKAGKQLILLIDNIDRLFRNIGKDANLLREQLMNFNDVRIIGGSTVMSEQFWKYNMPFYQFFSLRRLEPLTIEEVEALLAHWAEIRKLPEIGDLSRFHAGKIQTIRMLTDGTPRTMQLFVDMLLDRPLQKGFEYLKNILDQATPIYQERLGNLTPQQQKIVTELSFFWEATSVEDLIPVCKMEGKTISAQLGKLAKEGVVEKLKGEKRHLLYRLEERFFNLWLLMTQGGPKQRRKVKYLTIFLENWYNEDELKWLFGEFMEQLETGELKPEYIASMTKAFAHSRVLTANERDELLKKVLGLSEMKKEWLEQLPATSKVIFRNVLECIENHEYQQAIINLANLEQEHPNKALLLSFLYSVIGDTREGLLYWKRAINTMPKGFSFSKIGYMLIGLGLREDAEKYLLQDLKNETVLSDREIPKLYSSLAWNYYELGKNAEKAIEINRKLLKIKSWTLAAEMQASTLHLWAGNLDQFKIHHEKFFKTLTPEYIYMAGIHCYSLLIHKQYNILLDEFLYGPYKTLLKESFIPIFYSTLKLTNPSHPDLIKIPPELSESISEILLFIKQKQNFYYPKS